MLQGRQAHQIARVLRLRAGERIVLFDGGGQEYEVQLDAVQAERVTGQVVASRVGLAEPRVRVTLYQGMLKGDKFDMLLQKGTELGVAAFVPVICKRSVVRLDALSAERSQRWNRVVVEAAEQCGRSHLPVVLHPMAIGDVGNEVAEGGLTIIPWEEEPQVRLRDVLADRLASSTQTSPTVRILIGPEGGLAQDEVREIAARGAIVVSLGARVLRAETAALATVTAVLFAAGEFG